MSAKTQQIHVAMLIDAWFPTNGREGVFGGGQVHVRELSKQLETDFPVKVHLFYPTNPRIWYRFLWTFIGIASILRFNRKQPLDLIHSHGYNTGLTSKITSLLLKKPTIHTVHGSNLLELQKKSVKAYLEKYLLTKINYTQQISVSQVFLDYPNVNKPIIIPNGVHPELFDAITTRKTQNPSIIWVGRNDPVKGLSVLQDSIRVLRRTFPNLQVELVTGGRLKDEALIRAYKQAHVFVLPSYSEGQPLTLLEAWAAKLPVVVTNVGDNQFMVKPGKNGYLVKPGSSKSLTEAITMVLNDPATANLMGQSGYRHVIKHHAWSLIAQKTYQVYRQVLIAS